ncbi:MAG: SDR family NAD(P)-dependent oxidoreductase [Deltaproteobacteria bacterium]|nr:SDR family NAD(P)-dependent oxidoreductase [Deltaproteobacteria bacterium]
MTPQRVESWRAKFGPWALVTGATAGIGAHFARELARRGLNVVVNARQRDDVEGVAQNLAEQFGIETRAAVADLSRPGDVRALLDGVADLEIGLVIQNAGTMTLGALCEADIDAERGVAALHVESTLMLAHALVPPMRERGRGGLVIVSSTMGAFAAPSAANAAATKGWQRQFGIALAEELRGSGVNVLVLCPALTDTRAIRRLNFRALGKRPMPVDVPVRAALDALGRRTLVTVGGANALAGALLGLLPRTWVARIVRRYLRRLSIDNPSPR